MPSSDKVISKLETQLETVHAPQDRIDLLNKLAVFYRLDDNVQTQYYAEQAHALALQHDYPRGIARAMLNFAFVLYMQGETEQSLSQIMQALALANQHDIPIVEADALDQISFHQMNAGNYPDALESSLKARGIAEAINDGYMIFSTWNDLSIVYSSSGNNEQALSLFTQWQKRYHQDQPEIPSSTFYTVRHNIALIYLMQGLYEEALAYSQENLAWSRQQKSPDGVLYALGSVGEACLMLGQLDEAIQHFQEALILLNDNPDIGMEIDIYLNIGRYYLKLEQPHNALEALSNADAILKQTPFCEFTIRMYELFSSAYEQLGDIKQALAYSKRHHEKEREAFNTQADQRIKSMQAIYEAEQAEKEKEIYRLRNEALQYELEEHKRTEAERQKREHLRFELEKEHDLNITKTRIMERLSHEVRTPLAIIQTQSALLTHYTDHMTTEKRQASYDMITEQITNLTLTLDDIVSLLRGPEDQRDFHPQDVLIDDVLYAIPDRFKRQTAYPARLIAEINTTGCRMALDAQLLERIITELLYNASNFLRMNPPVTFHASVDGTALIISVSDQGIGIPKDEQEKIFSPLFRGTNIDEGPGIGLGLALVRNWVHIHHGKIRIESQVGQGTTVTLYLNS